MCKSQRVEYEFKSKGGQEVPVFQKQEPGSQNPSDKEGHDCDGYFTTDLFSLPFVAVVVEQDGLSAGWVSDATRRVVCLRRGDLIREIPVADDTVTAMMIIKKNEIDRKNYQPKLRD